MEVASGVCSSPSCEIPITGKTKFINKYSFSAWHPQQLHEVVIPPSEKIATRLDASRVKNRGKLFYCRFFCLIISLLLPVRHL